MEELYQEQDSYGGWGKLQSKDYSSKEKFPTSMTAINGCLYIGLAIEDRDILNNKTTLGYLDCKVHVHCEKGSPIGPINKIIKDVSLTNSQALRVIDDDWIVIE